MGFYDKYNLDGLKLFSGIKKNPTVSEPCLPFLSAIEFLSAMKQLKITPPRSIKVAEIGIGFGATTLPALKLLDANDVYYAFDFEDTVKALEEDLQVIARDFGIKCQLVTKGNSHKQFDSYNWNLSNMIFEMRKKNEAGIFDVVYLDGAHTLHHDGLAVCLLKELIKDGGFLILDDLFWSYNVSPKMREVGDQFFSEEQVTDQQILRVQELFLSNDPKFERLSSPKDYRGIFRKRSH